MDKNIKVKYNVLDNLSFDEKHKNIKNKRLKTFDEYLDICKQIRDPRYETFRIFYMKNDKIVAHEAITNKIPNLVVFGDEADINKRFEKIKSRIKRLNADGYYLAHNHPSNSSTPSSNDKIITQEFIDKIDGFLGHLIVGCKDNYSYIEKDQKGKLIVYDDKYIQNEEIKKELETKTIYDIKITNIKSLVYVLKHLLEDKDYSTTLLLDGRLNIRMVLDIPNKMFNQKEENLNGFFKNIARTCGASCIVVGTQNKQTYKELIKHVDYGTIFNIAYFNGKEYVADEYMSLNRLFEKEIRQKGRKER